MALRTHVRTRAAAIASALAIAAPLACAPVASGPVVAQTPRPEPARDTIVRRDTVTHRDTVVHRDTMARRDTALRVTKARRVDHGIRLCAGGDVTVGTNLDPAWARTAAARLRREHGLSAEPDTLLAPLRPLLDGADVVLLNVEGAIGEGSAPSKCGKRSTNCFAFRQPVAAAWALRSVAPDSAVVVGNVANNHSRDAGPAGFDTTRALLAEAGVLVTGADTLATPVVTARGDTIAVIGFYTSSDTPDARDLAAVRRHVERAVARYGTVVVTMHLGAEGAKAQRTRDATEIFLGHIDRGNPVAFARTALAAGATMVIGHGPHVLRAAEWQGDRLVVYSLGNLLTYGPFTLREPLNRGAVVCATIDSARAVSHAELRSTMQLAPGVLRADPTGRALVLVDSLSRLDFPHTGVRAERMRGERGESSQGRGALVPPAAVPDSALSCSTAGSPRRSCPASAPRAGRRARP